MDIVVGSLDEDIGEGLKIQRIGPQMITQIKPAMRSSFINCIYIFAVHPILVIVNVFNNQL